MVYWFYNGSCLLQVSFLFMIIWFNAILWSNLPHLVSPIPGTLCFPFTLFFPLWDYNSKIRLVVTSYFFRSSLAKCAMSGEELILCGILMVVFHTGYSVFDVSMALSWLRYSYDYESFAVRNQIDVKHFHAKTRLNIISCR